MASNKPSGKKKRLSKATKQNRWAPFWLIPKVFGRMKGVHPSRLAKGPRRSWRKNKVRA